MDDMKKMCEAMMKKDSGQMAKMMESMPMMKEMCNAMFENSSKDSNCCSSGCCDKKEDTNSNIIPSELQMLFQEWVDQIKEEIITYKAENPTATLEKIAKHFGLSEQSITYINQKSDDLNNNSYINLRIKKTNNACSLCEDYVRNNESKPIVVLSCEGACLRGEISRKAANILCHSLLPETTVRLCLGSALTKEAGQRSLVQNAKKIIALEGCPVDCGSRMICGLPFEVQPEVIHTDVLANFDKSLFGINELSEEDINQLALSVARQIAEKL